MNDLHIDTPEPMVPRILDSDVFRHPIVLRLILTTVVLLVVATSHNRNGTAISLIGGTGLIGYALLHLWVTYRAHRRGVELVYALAMLTCGVYVLTLAHPDPDDRVLLGYSASAALFIAGVRSLVVPLQSDRGFLVKRVPAGGLILASAFLVAFPNDLLGFVLATVAVGSAGLTLIVIGRLHDIDDREGSVRSLVTGWLAEREQPEAVRLELQEKVIFDGRSLVHRLVRFFVLMGFASVIAAMGVITDSTAVVIGAMLIAPLMTPLMGIAMSLSMGWPRLVGRSAVVAAAGSLWAIGIGFVLGALSSNWVEIANNSQIQSRIAPTGLDLIVAVAAGAAGAYGLSRRDVSDSLPGVAIAIALVPPLTVVGICYSHGDVAAGNGALLLFLTNALAIMMFGALTFVLTGATPLTQLTTQRHRVKHAAVAIGVMAVLVLAGLLLNGRELATRAIEAGTVRSTVREWVESVDDFEVVELDDDSDVFFVHIEGPSGIEPPSATALRDLLATNLDREVVIELRVGRVDVYTSG